MLRNLTTILELEKFQLIAAENDRTGVELAKKEKPDLILSEIAIPELDGFGVITALRGTRRNRVHFRSSFLRLRARSATFVPE